MDLALPPSAPAATLPSADPEGHTAASSPRPAWSSAAGYQNTARVHMGGGGEPRAPALCPLSLVTSPGPLRAPFLRWEVVAPPLQYCGACARSCSTETSVREQAQPQATWKMQSALQPPCYFLRKQQSEALCGAKTTNSLKDTVGFVCLFFLPPVW